MAIEPGLTLAQHLFLAGAYESVPLCSGAGRCGLCQVRFLEGAAAPGADDAALIRGERLEEGWRLACCRQPAAASVVEVGLARGRGDAPVAPVDQNAWLGIDLGTTSIHWKACVDGRIWGASFLNPQLGAGADVMSRLALARHPLGARRLREVVAQAVRRIVSGLPVTPGRICLAANSCMTALALGLDASRLAAAPYRLDWAGDSLAELDAALPQVYIPPLLAPFVGADISAGLAALALAEVPPRLPALLADLGTNGEFALMLQDGRVSVASVPMGPALEGVGMSGGMMAGPGAAVAFGLTPAGLAPVAFDGPGRPVRAISGTGYVSLIAGLLRLGALTPQGHFADSPASPLAGRALAGLAGNGRERVLRLGELTLPASDVEALLKVKAAFDSAVGLLLEQAGLGFADVERVYLAGALGEHVRAADLETLGFVPAGGADRITAVGNTSLAGACLAASDTSVRQWLSGLVGRTSLVEVVAMPGFQPRFVNAMRFSYAG